MMRTSHSHRYIAMSHTVDNSVRTIKKNLDQGVLDWDVSRRELQDNNRKIAELAPKDRNEVVKKLSDDDLKNWTQEIDGENEPLTASERGELFGHLAEGLDGEQLARVSRAFDGSPGGRVALGSAVASQASPQAKLAFIQAVKNDIDGDYKALQGRDGNAEALVASDVLASLKNHPGEFNLAVGSLSNDQLQAVMKVGFGRVHVPHGPNGLAQTGGSQLFSPQATLDILDAAARSPDARTKAQVFMAAMGDDVRTLPSGTPFESQVRDAVKRLVDSDPHALVYELKERSNPSGSTLVTYIEDSMEKGKPGEVNDLIGALRNDPNGPNGTVVDLSAKEGEVLGFAIGATTTAINNRSDSAEAKADQLKNLFGGAFGVAGSSNGVTGGASAAVNAIVADAFDQAVLNVKENNGKVQDAIYEAALPRDGDGYLVRGSGRDAFHDALSTYIGRSG